MGLERWNQDRPDAPEEFRKQAAEPEEAPKKKRGRKSKAEEESAE
jgi:hypothetical protein